MSAHIGALYLNRAFVNLTYRRWIFLVRREKLFVEIFTGSRLSGTYPPPLPPIFLTFPPPCRAALMNKSEGKCDKWRLPTHASISIIIIHHGAYPLGSARPWKTVDFSEDLLNERYPFHV